MLTLVWAVRGGKATQPPDRRYPKGMDVDIAGDADASCSTTLPYPAECIGTHMVRCDECGATAAVTAAGRADDPRSLRMPCRREAESVGAPAPNPPRQQTGRPPGRLL